MKQIGTFPPEVIDPLVYRKTLDFPTSELWLSLHLEGEIQQLQLYTFIEKEPILLRTYDKGYIQIICYLEDKEVYFIKVEDSKNLDKMINTMKKNIALSQAVRAWNKNVI